MNLVDDVGVAHLHTAVTERSQCSATVRLTLATQRQAADRQGNWVRHFTHRSESWDARQRLSWALRQLLETWEKAPSQMWKPCFLGHHLDVSQSTSGYPPRVQPGRPCFEHGDVEERGLDAITTKGEQKQPWPCRGTAGSVHGEFQVLIYIRCSTDTRAKCPGLPQLSRAKQLFIHFLVE